MLDEATRRERHDLELLRRYQEDHDLQAREELTGRLMPLVRSLARRYASGGDTLEDVVQVGALGLVKAIDRFDRDAGHRFVTFAAPTISGEIKRYFRDTSWDVHVPRSMKELDARVTGARRVFAEAAGREPTTTELAEELSIDVDQVKEGLRASSAHNALSLDRPCTASEDGRALQPISAPSIEPGYVEVEQRDLVVRACRGLSERQREIVLRRFFGEELQHEIASRIGVSQMQISRLIRAALCDMRENLAHEEERHPAELAA